jgi:membrane dipeptidase
MKTTLTTLLVLLTFSLYAQENIDKELYNKAVNILERTISIDSHSDTPLRFQDSTFDLGKRNTRGCFDLPRMEEGRLSAEFFAIFVSNGLEKENPSQMALGYLENVYKAVNKYNSKVSIAYSTKDVLRLYKQGKKIICLGMENGLPIENDFGNLAMFYNLGIRYITLTHSRNNSICDSSTDSTETWSGLSPFGKKMVYEMNKKGIMVDVSHISDKAFWDVIKISKAPVIASHSCCRVFSSNPRNMSDEMIKALAKNGGVLQLNFYPAYLDENYNQNIEKYSKFVSAPLDSIRKLYKDDPKTLREEIAKFRKINPYPESVGAERLIDHVDHIVKLVGIDYVGIGSDFDGLGVFPKGLEDVSKMPIITYYLLKRGYSEQDIKKIVGGNLLRVWEEVEKTSQRNDL